MRPCTAIMTHIQTGYPGVTIYPYLIAVCVKNHMGMMPRDDTHLIQHDRTKSDRVSNSPPKIR